MRERFAPVIANHAVLHRAGARIVCGTDAGVGPSKPHDVLPYGVSGSLPAIGMTNAEALTAAIAVAAEVCGLASITGTLKRAMTLASWRSRRLHVPKSTRRTWTVRRR
jgi:imidazolonepropionase-like amidohydrolase